MKGGQGWVRIAAPRWVARVWERGKTRPFITVLFVAVLAFLWFGAAATRGIDGHHDGYVARTAMDVRHGRALFAETWTWYGPLHAYLNVVGLLVLGDRLLSIQIVTVLGYAIASGALWAFWKQVGGVSVAWLGIASFWLSAPEVVRDGLRHEWGQQTWIQELPLLPWPSAWALAFSAVGFCFFLRALDFERHHTRCAAISGIAFGLAATVRLGPGLATLGAVGLSAGVVGLCGARRGLRVAGVAFGTAILPLALIYGPSIIAAGPSVVWDQQVVVPRRWARPGLFPALDAVLNRTWEGLPLAIALAMISGAVLIGAHLVVRVGRGRRLLGAVALVVAIGAGREAIGGWPTLGRISKAQSGWASALISLSILCVLGALCIAGIGVIQRKRLAPAEVRVVVATILASSGLVQLVPVVEERHIWWSTAPLIGVALAMLMTHIAVDFRRVALLAITLALAPLLLAGGVGFVERLQGPWVSPGGGPFLDGIKVRPELASELKPLLQEVDRARAETGQLRVVALGHDALFGLIGEETEPPSRYSVVLGAYPDPVSIAAYVKRHRPLLWIENFPRELLDAYARSLRYCVAAAHDSTSELPMNRAVLRPCPGPSRAEVLTWNLKDGSAPPWAERVI